MTDALTFLAAPFALCMVIASIHVYLGMHVLEREVIFVDLALAQLAALGATIAGVLEEEHADDLHVALLAFAFTAFGAAIFALAGRLRERLSLEAVVGIVYAVASSAVVIVLSHAPHGAEHMKEMLVGSLLLADWGQVRDIALAYLVLGAVQIALARRFIALSWQNEPHAPSASARWDFAFYLLFGLVITLSVQVAGVLPVFSYLIVPAVVTKLFSLRLAVRLGLGWAAALIASVGGLAASWAWDLPTGAAIVAAFGALLVVAAIARGFFGAQSPA